MKPKDNNKLTLSAYSDWLEENNQLELAEEIREEMVGVNHYHFWAYDAMFADIIPGFGHFGWPAAGMGRKGVGAGVGFLGSCTTSPVNDGVGGRNQNG